MSRATFSGIEIGKSALVVSQLGIDVTSHNIANVDTKGYTRQRIESTAYDPFWTLGRTLPVESAKVGVGVAIKVLDQIRSAYLDSRYRTENTINAYWEKRVQGLTYVQSYFDYTIGPTSINDAIASFFSAIETVSKDTVESAQRTLLQNEGQYLAQQFNTIYAGLIDLQSTYNEVVKVTVDRINTIAEQIVELNKSIYAFECTGLIANDLRDKRNLLVDELSAIIPVEYHEEPHPVGTGNSKFVVKIGGQILADHDISHKLDTAERPNTIAGEDPVLIPIWAERPYPDYGKLCEVYLGNNRSNFVTLNVPTADPMELDEEETVKNAVARLNALAVSFSNLKVPFEDVDYVLKWNTAGYNIRTDTDPDHVALITANPDIIAAFDIFREMQSFFAPGSLVVSAEDCDQGGFHPIIQIQGATSTVDFSRSAGCIHSHYPTTRLNYNAPVFYESPGDLLVTGGELMAYLEIRDSDDPKAQGIPYYVEMLNNLARGIVQEINKQHRLGWTDPLNAESETGINFFSEDYDEYYLDETTKAIYYREYDEDLDEWFWVNKDDPDDPPRPDTAVGLDGLTLVDGIALVTAKNIKLSKEVEESAFNIACSSVMVVRDGESDELQSGNNENMLDLYNLFLKKDIFVQVLGKTIDIGSIDGYATNVRFEVGTTLNTARNSLDNSQTLLIAVTNQRLAISGVSLDEEMTHMIKYQYAFQGASRVINAMDELLDVLINRTGRVGL